MDKDDVRSLFETTGVVRLDGAFTPPDAAAMREAVWGYVERKVGLRPDDRSTWPEGWLGFSWKGLKRSRIFSPFVNNPAVVSALDAIFGVGGWRPPRPGAQILVSFPQPATHRVVDRYRKTVAPGTGGGMVNWRRFHEA